MQTQRRALTAAEVAALDSEYKRLVTLLETQTVEQVVFIRKQISSDPKLSKARANHLDQLLELGGFKLKLFRITDANVLEENQVQVTYEIHDDLYDYLKQADSELPKQLRGFLDGGTLIDPKQNKDTAEDPMPLTGKTKTGVPRYDSILESQGKKPN